MEIFQVVVLVYVDNLVILWFTEDGVKRVKEKLRSLLNLTDLGEICDYPGLTFERKRNGMNIHQAEYCGRLPKRFGMKRAKSTLTLMVDTMYNMFEGAVPSEARQKNTQTFPYRKLLRSLLFLSSYTRPDITLAANVLGRFV